MYNLSIIIPAYNAEKYIEKCINSILKQKYYDYEILVIDDGSKDNTYKICEEIAKNNACVKIFHKENGGVSSARNMGIQNANGKYIMFMDSDDWILENSLNKINQVMNLNVDKDMYIFRIVENLFESNTYKVKDVIAKLIYTELINSPCSKIYSNKIIKDNNILFDTNTEIGEDKLFNITYIQYVKEVVLNSYNYYCYNQDNSNSLTKKYKKDKYNKLMYVNDKAKEITRKYNQEDIMYALNYIRYKNIFSCIMDLSHKDCTYTYKEKLDIIKKMKKENRDLKVKGLGIKKSILVSLLKIIPSSILLIICSFVHKRKVRR